MSFSERLEAAGEVASDVAAGSTEEIPGRLEKLAHLSPRGAVLESWLEIEELLFAASRRETPNLSPRASVSRLLNQLAQSGAISPEAYALAVNLRQLRNDALHLSDREITPSQALEYARAARQLASQLS